MFWAGIVGKRLVGPYQVDSKVKMNSETYSTFLEANFFKWFSRQKRSFKQTCMLMHDNAPAHASQYTAGYLASKGVKDERIMQWPAQSPDLNPIENLWSIIKRQVYPGGKQYSSVNELWQAIQDVCTALEPQTIENLTKSMDDRHFRVIQANGAYIKM